METLRHAAIADLQPTGNKRDSQEWCSAAAEGPLSGYSSDQCPPQARIISLPRVFTDHLPLGGPCSIASMGKLPFISFASVTGSVQDKLV